MEKEKKERINSTQSGNNIPVPVTVSVSEAIIANKPDKAILGHS